MVSAFGFSLFIHGIYSISKLLSFFCVLPRSLSFCVGCQKGFGKPEPLKLLVVW